MGSSRVEDILQAGLDGTELPTAVSRVEILLKEWIEQGGNIDDILVAGSNITLTKNADGTITIDASGEVSSEDTVARAAIAAIKNGETLDSFGDVESALGDKANATDLAETNATVATKADSTALEATNSVVATKANASDVATADANLQAQIDNIVGGSTEDAEVINARVGADGTSYTTLKERLDTEITRLSGDISKISLDVTGYISTSGDTANLTPVVNTAYHCKVIDCQAGDMFTVTSQSGTASLPYAFVDSSNNFILKSPTSTVNKAHIIAPANAVKVIFNTGYISNAKVSQGWIDANSVFKELNDKNADTAATLKSIYDTTQIAYTERGYIANGKIISLAPVDNNSYKCCVVECTEGDVFTVNAIGAVAARLWLFADTELNRLTVSDININSDVIVAPANAKYLILNSTAAATTNTFKAISIKDAVKLSATITNNAFESCIKKVNTDVFLYHIENNLSTDGITNMPNCEVTLDGVASPDNYGKSGARYKVPIPDYKKMHMYLEWQWKEALPYISTSTRYRIIDIFNGAVSAEMYSRNSGVSNSEIYRPTIANALAGNIGGYSIPFQPKYEQTSNGKTAICIRYTGERLSAEDYAECTWTENSVEFMIHSTSGSIGSVSFEPDETVYSLVNKINALENITCIAVEVADHTCSELLPVLCPNTFSMDGTYTNGNSETVYDNCFLNVPYAYDDTWHTIELVADYDELEAYIAFDGVTQKIPISPNVKSTADVHKRFLIGNDQFNIRNLVFDYDGYGDAEVIQSVTYPYSAKDQLISSHNPRLIIFEGHGIENIMEEDADHSSENMSATTDRLRYVFSYLTSKGYQTVSWEDIIDWKINNKPLPKRCFNIMMDDYYVDNYMNYQKRQPFEQYGVKPGLAIVSDNYAMDDTLTIDGNTYTISDIMRSINIAGWHPCSHTSKHYLLSQKSPQEVENILKESALSCNDHGIYSDILVYPQGLTGDFFLSALNRSPFKLAINIVANRYNCKATKRFNLCRIDIGSRTPLSGVLSSIV